jgi:SAM-dependent methyltransferase
LSDRILKGVERYYSDRVAEHGPTARGVDWNNAASQELRFTQLLRLCGNSDEAFTLNDYGCGYGALITALERRRFEFCYTGFDISPAMLEQARRKYEPSPRIRFVDAEQKLRPADYTVASGVFNVKLGIPNSEWEAYVLHALETLVDLSERGCAFNMLTTYADLEKMRSDLYYGDPRFYFDHCKRHLSRNVALLHDYGLYEFTMIVRFDD